MTKSNRVALSLILGMIADQPICGLLAVKEALAKALKKARRDSRA